MRTQWKDVSSDIAKFRKSGILPESCVPFVKAWIESQFSRYGRGLEREDTIQDLWLFMLGDKSPLKTCHCVAVVIYAIRNRIYDYQRKTRIKRRIKIERSLDHGE